MRHDLAGFTGDPRFIQNDYAQKMISKLRSSIAGIYKWRLGPAAPAEYQPETDAEKQALINEADFAFRQAFALCPSSPEAVFPYVSFLLQFRRLDDAQVIGEAGLKADPQNQQFKSVLDTVKSYKKQSAADRPAQADLGRREDRLKANPANAQAALVESPALETANPAQVPILTVSIDANGALRLGANPMPVSIERFKEELVAAVAKTPNLLLHISADKNAPIKMVIKVMDAAKEAKVNRVSVHESPEGL